MIERRPGIVPLQRSRLTNVEIVSRLIALERLRNPDSAYLQGLPSPDALLSQHGLVRRNSFAYLTDDHLVRFPEVFASRTAAIQDMRAFACSTSDALRKKRGSADQAPGSSTDDPAARIADSSDVGAEAGLPISREGRSNAMRQRRRCCSNIEDDTLDIALGYAVDILNILSAPWL
eukprot:TRINITY_DN29236_c0_g2_i2.p1 TRINITY_DN29236_c0_g2~~TRINITY_DN29236_c0_g2_i2.p1  ORF type:complete len:176 (+),score=22.07 TRINITY_DN29236_c0_g2_i2:72-599(+)